MGIATAHRRQESPPPPENNNSPLLAVDLGLDGTTLGALSVGTGGASIGIAPESNLLELTVGFSYVPGANPINVGLTVADTQGVSSSSRFSSQTLTFSLSTLMDIPSWHSRLAMEQPLLELYWARKQHASITLNLDVLTPRYPATSASQVWPPLVCAHGLRASHNLWSFSPFFRGPDIRPASNWRQYIHRR